MKSIIIATATMFIFCSAKAQSVTVFPFAKIQKFLDRAEDQQYVNFMGANEKITKQEITETSYTFYYRKLPLDTKWVEETTNIQWFKAFKLYSRREQGNDKLTVCGFDFNYKLDWSTRTQGATGSVKLTRENVEFYILTTDLETFERLIKNKE